MSNFKESRKEVYEYGSEEKGVKEVQEKHRLKEVLIKDNEKGEA